MRKALTVVLVTAVLAGFPALAPSAVRSATSTRRSATR